MNIFNNFSLKKHNSFRVDVCTKKFIEYDSEEELLSLLPELRAATNYIHIGSGTNILFTGNYSGYVIHSNIKGIDVVSETEESIDIKVGGGVIWDDFVRYAVCNSWYGVENLSNIPGETGAAAVQNIGAYGVEIKDLIVEVNTLNIEGFQKKFLKEECKYSYRGSYFKNNKDIFITSVILRLSKIPFASLDYSNLRTEIGDDISLINIRNTILRIREEKLPDYNELGNVGSYYMNPVIDQKLFKHLNNLYPEMPFYTQDNCLYKIPAAWLIEKAGWKGKRKGDVGIYDKHALVLVNYGNATPMEIINFSEEIKKSIAKIFCINIKEEVLIIK